MIEEIKKTIIDTLKIHSDSLKKFNVTVSGELQKDKINELIIKIDKLIKLLESKKEFTISNMLYWLTYQVNYIKKLKINNEIFDSISASYEKFQDDLIDYASSVQVKNNEQIYLNEPTTYKKTVKTILYNDFMLHNHTYIFAGLFLMLIGYYYYTEYY